MKNFKELEDYYSGNASEQERADFELKLNLNPSFRAEYETYIASQNLIEYIIGQDLLEKLPNLNTHEIPTHNRTLSQGVSNEINSKLTSNDFKIVSINRNDISSDKSDDKKKFSSFGKLSVAATFLILVSVFASVIYFTRGDDFTSITEQNVSFLDLSQMRGDRNSQKYQQLIELQDAGNYAKANLLIDELMSEDPDTYNYLIYFKGQNNFRLKNFVFAEKDFNTVVELKLPKYMEQAQLMLVFTSIETKNVEGARIKIQELIKQPYYSYKNVLLQVERELEEK